MTPEIPEKIPIVKGLYANKSEILQAKTNPKTLNEAQTNVSDSNVITFSSFNTSNLETTTSKIRLKCIDGNDKEVSIVEVIDETKIRVNEDLSECIGAVDEDGNVVSGNQIFVYGEEVDDFVFLKKEVFIPICVSSIQELDRRLEAEKTKVADLMARVEALENNVP